MLGCAHYNNNGIAHFSLCFGLVLQTVLIFLDSTNIAAHKIKMHFKMKVIFIYGVVLTIFYMPTLQGLRGCDKLDEKLNLSKAKKRQLNLKQCGGTHSIDADGQISGGREKVKRYETTQVSSFLLILI